MRTPEVLLVALCGCTIGCTTAFDPKAQLTMPSHRREMTKEEQAAWEARHERLGDLRSYLPPNTIETMPCDYTKGDMHEILVFAAKGNLDDIGRWFTEQLPIYIYEEHDYDPGQLTLYSLYDRDSRAISVILADSETEEATGNFGSYVGTEYLSRMIAHRPCVVGALYLEELGWYKRNVKDSSKAE